MIFFPNMCRIRIRIGIKIRKSDPDRYQTDADPQHWVQGASLPELVSTAEIYSIQ